MAGEPTATGASMAAAQDDREVHDRQLPRPTLVLILAIAFVASIILGVFNHRFRTRGSVLALFGVVL